jgi:molecular chaperone HscB
MDPFSTLGIEPTFDIDLNAVEKRHRELSRALHPDKYASAPPGERREALRKAVEVNEAWRVVRDPIRRAEALFQKAGVGVGERSEPKPTSAFLMETLELRETLAEAKAAKDFARIERLAGEVDAQRRAVMARLAKGLRAGARIEDLAALVPALGELRFHQRFLDEVSAIEDELAEAAVLRVDR